MPYCPNCGDEIATDVSSCPTCEAVFGPASAWHPLVEPPAHRDLQSIAEFRAATDLKRQKREREARSQNPKPEEPAEAVDDRQPPFTWNRASWGGVIGIVIFILAYLGSGSLMWLFVVPYAALIGGLKARTSFQVLGASVMPLILFGMFLELATIDMMLSLHYQPELYRSSGMGPVVVAFYMYYVVAPATFLIALITMCVVANASRSSKWAVPAVVFCMCAMLLSVCSYFALDIRKFPSDSIQRGLERFYMWRSFERPKPPPEPLRPPDLRGTPAQQRTYGAEWALGNSITDESLCDAARSRHFVEACKHTVRRQTGR